VTTKITCPTRFLAKCLPADVRPGLKRTHATKREHELEKKKSECNLTKMKKSKAVLESEKREEGLQKSLDSSNKGFALLAKMGYKPGDSLGKSNTGIVEPIGIEVKNNRGGLGAEKAIKQIQETKAKLRTARKKTSNLAPISAEDFRASQSKKIKAKRVEGDLYRAQKATRQLDMSKEFTEPIESWFWPKVVQDATDEAENDLEEPKIKDITFEDQIHAEDNLDEIEEEEEEEVEIPPDEMLKIITEYLRTEYLFCIWCGITFENAEDLKSNCPGNSRDDHDD